MSLFIAIKLKAKTVHHKPREWTVKTVNFLLHFYSSMIPEKLNRHKLGSWIAPGLTVLTIYYPIVLFSSLQRLQNHHFYIHHTFITFNFLDWILLKNM